MSYFLPFSLCVLDNFSKQFHNTPCLHSTMFRNQSSDVSDVGHSNVFQNMFTNAPVFHQFPPQEDGELNVFQNVFSTCVKTVVQPSRGECKNNLEQKSKLTNQLSALDISDSPHGSMFLSRRENRRSCKSHEIKTVRTKPKSKRYNSRTVYDYKLQSTATFEHLKKVLTLFPKRYQKFFVFRLYGKRSCIKRTATFESLPNLFQFTYNQIVFKLKQNPKRIEQIKSYDPDRKSNNQNISGRTIYYFITKFCQSRNIHYYVDTSEYPYRIVGNHIYSVQNYIEPDVEEVMIRNGYQLVNVYQSYQQQQRANRSLTSFAPFKRSHKIYCPVIQEDMAICWWYFFMWFDNIAGMIALELLANQVSQDIQTQKKKNKINNPRRKKPKSKSTTKRTRQVNTRKRSANLTKFNRKQSKSKRIKTNS